MPRKGLRRALSEFPPPTIASKHPRPTSQTVIKRFSFVFLSYPSLNIETKLGVQTNDDLLLFFIATD